MDSWSDNALAYMNCAGNDLQQAGQLTALYSSGFSNGNGFYVNAENLEKSAIVFSVRQLVAHTWINHNDQFLQPTMELADEFRTDCLVWMLFHGKNLTASADDLEWHDKKWSIVNHFVPFSEAEVGSPDRFESDFMVQYLSGKTLSAEAQAVLNAGRELWKSYFSSTDVYSVRDELKLNRADVGWYQIRNVLKKRNENGDFPPVSFASFETVYRALSDKLRPMVYELGFLRV